MGSKILFHQVIENHELSYLVAQNYFLEERMSIIGHVVKINQHGIYGMRAPKAACCMIKYFYGDVINRELLHEKYKVNIQIARHGKYTAICHFPTLKVGAGSICSEGRNRAMSMPPMGNNCFWHAMVTVFNAHVGSNKYTVRALYVRNEEAMKYKDLFILHMFNEMEYAYIIEGRTPDTLAAKHEAGASVAHVVATDVRIPICVIDDTGKEILGYRLGGGEHDCRCIIIRHGHAYVPTTKIPKEDLEHLPPYDYHVAQVFKGDEFEHIEQPESDEKEEESEDESDQIEDDADGVPTGTNPDVKVEEEEVQTSTDFISAIQAALAFMQRDTETGKAIAVAQAVAPLVGLSYGMYTLIRGIVQGVWKWHDYLVHITSVML